MIRIGMMDLDTGHAPAFTKFLNNMDGVVVTAVYDHGEIRRCEDVQGFCAQNKCVFTQTYDELADQVDGVMVLGVNWNHRVERACEMIKRKVPVFMCKPVLGSVADMQKLVALQEQTQSLVMMGSGWRWCDPTQLAATKIVYATVKTFDVYAPCPRFYYGIHAWEFLAGVFGPDINWIQRISEVDGYTKYQCELASGVQGHVHVGGQTQRVIQWEDHQGKHELALEIPAVHHGFCNTFIQMIRTRKMPAPIASQIKPIGNAILAEQACELGGRQSIGQLEQDRVVDSTEFMKNYKPPRELVDV